MKTAQQLWSNPHAAAGDPVTVSALTIRSNPVQTQSPQIIKMLRVDYSCMGLFSNCATLLRSVVFVTAE